MKYTLTLLLIPALALACTSFQLRSAATMAKSYDWHTQSGLWVTNLRNQKKKAFHLNEHLSLVDWTSRFGSVTLNQYGRELPNSGINERGLVAEVLWLDSSVYPETSGLPGVSELQWIQYILDVAGNIEEATLAAQKVVVRPVYAKVHYFVCDPQRCASFEYVNGKLFIHATSDLPHPVLTNHTYDESLTHLQQFVGFGGTKPLPAGPGSLARFARAASRVKNFPEHGALASTYAFEILSDVAQSDSVWNVVYDQVQRSIWLKTRLEPRLRRLITSSIDFSCTSQSQVADLNAFPNQGFVNTLLKPYSRATNLTFIRAAVKNLGTQFPELAIQKLARYPESLECQE